MALQMCALEALIALRSALVKDEVGGNDVKWPCICMQCVGLARTIYTHGVCTVLFAGILLNIRS